MKNVSEVVKFIVETQKLYSTDKVKATMYMSVRNDIFCLFSEELDSEDIKLPFVSISTMRTKLLSNAHTRTKFDVVKSGLMLYDYVDDDYLNECIDNLNVGEFNNS